MNLEQFNQKLEKEWQAYYGKTIEKIAEDLGMNFDLLKGKLSVVMVVNQFLKKSKINQKDKVDGRTLAIKTVRLQGNGVPKESMSFEQIDFIGVHSEKWENSFIYNKFRNTLFCFIVFQSIGKDVYFKGFKLWQMPIEILEKDIFDFWECLRKILNEGVKIELKKHGATYIKTNNLPGSKMNKVVHVRPKAKDSNDIVELPDGQMITKQAYWINASYIGGILKDIKEVTPTRTESRKKFDINQHIEWQEILSKEVYTIDEIINLGKQEKSNFTESDIKEKNLKQHGYHIQNTFVVKNQILDVSEYLEGKILKSNYFDSRVDTIFQTSLAKRKIENLENAYKLLRVEDTIYLTEKGMQKAKVSREDIVSYKTAIEKYVGEELFTLASIKGEGFYHEVDDYGFDNVFYENIIKRPGRIHSYRFAGITFFAKTKYKISSEIIMKDILKGKDSISLFEMTQEIISKYKCRVPEDRLENAILNTKMNLYYSIELHRLFGTKKMYLDYINR
ncbi:MutH/Sau3AI family endonuclease [Bacillus cereus]|uniref:MutH/Sau3AI family endonuclease n=1 Tax=Bacillus cereus TaxID=1396 RepID=UPI00381CEC06